MPSQLAKNLQAIETKLLYETMASPLVERTLHATKLSIGKWEHYTTRQVRKGNLHVFYNVGIPVTFEILEDRQHNLLLDRARPTFVWEDTFEPHKKWLNSVITADWMDGIMFPSVLPHDFKFAIVSSNRIEYPIGNKAFRYATEVYFQPIGAKMNRPWNYPLEVENAFINVGMVDPSMSINFTKENHVSFKQDRTEIERMLIKYGFTYSSIYTMPFKRAF
jgi:hypothetical protein